MIHSSNFCRMMTSSNETLFRVTGPLYGEFTCQRWIPRTKASDAELLCFLCWINGWVNNREAGDLKRHRAHNDVIVMGVILKIYSSLSSSTEFVELWILQGIRRQSLEHHYTVAWICNIYLFHNSKRDNVINCYTVLAGLLVGHETWPPIVWHQPFVGDWQV